MDLLEFIGLVALPIWRVIDLPVIAAVLAIAGYFVPWRWPQLILLGLSIGVLGYWFYLLVDWHPLPHR